MIKLFLIGKKIFNSIISNKELGNQKTEAYFAYVKMTGNCLNSKQTGISIAGREALSL